MDRDNFAQMIRIPSGNFLVGEGVGGWGFGFSNEAIFYSRHSSAISVISRVSDFVFFDIFSLQLNL